MNCNLLKEKKEFKDSNGKTRFTYNYFLEFANGERVNIVPRYYDIDGIKEETKREHLQRANVVNATKLGAFADLVNYEE